MRNTKKIRLTRELHETLVFRKAAARLNCPACGCEREFMTPDEVTSVFSIGTREILRFVEMGQFHATESEHGQMLICLVSINECSDGQASISDRRAEKLCFSANRRA